MDEITADRGAVQLIANTFADAIEALASRVAAAEQGYADPLRQCASDLRAAVRPTAFAALEPAQGATVPPDQPVRVTFTAPVVPESIMLVVGNVSGGKPLKAQLSYDEETFTAELVPRNGFAPGVEYKATLKAATGLGHWDLPREESWTFIGGEA